MSESDQRTETCARDGHQPPIVWRIRRKGLLYVYLLCAACGTTRPPVVNGARSGAN